MVYLIYLCFGAFVGTLSGLLGIGGGIVIVPFLLFFLKESIHGDVITPLALGTSHFIILFTSLSSIYNHHKKGAVFWSVVKDMVLGLVLGCILGAFLATSLNGLFLQKLIGIFNILMALQMIFKLQPKTAQEFPNKKILISVGSFIGFLSSIFGMGGGAFIVPFLTYCKMKAQNAVATSSACCFPIAISSSISYIYAGWNIENLPEFSLGYIYLPAFLFITISSVSFAKFGVYLNHKISSENLKKVFAVLLILVGCKSLFFT